MSRVIRFVQAAAPHLATLAFLLGGGLAHAQSPDAAFPQRPVRLIAAGAPGGGLDIIGRQLAERLEKTWGQPVLIDNRPGAAGAIAFNAVAKAPADGYTLLLSTDGVTASPSLGLPNAVDPTRDFTAVSLLAQTTDVLLVRADSPIKTLEDFVRHARARHAEGKTLSIGSPGLTTTSHLAGELFGLRAGVPWTHAPYKGGPPAVADLLGGHIDALWILAAPIVPHVQSGKLRALAVVSGKRLGALPDTPTVAETGIVPGFAVVNWIGVLAPAGTPPAVVRTLSDAFGALVADPQLRPALQKQGFDPDGRGPAALTQLLKTNVGLWSDTIKQAKLAAPH